MPEPLMTVQQVADYLQISRASVYVMIKDGEINSIKLGKHHRRIERDELRRWVKNHSALAA